MLVDETNDVELFFLRPRDIAVYVGQGTVHAGITGRDLLLDSGVDAVEHLPLGFARSTFRFAAPKGTMNKAFTISYLIKNNTVIGFLCFTDKLKPTAKKAVEFLQSKNIEVIMLTGDNEATARAVANELGIKNYQANCFPEDKINKIKELQKQGKVVAMTDRRAHV